MMELDRDPGGPKTYRPGSATLNYSKNEKASIPPCGTMSINIFALLTLVLLFVLSSKYLLVVVVSSQCNLVGRLLIQDCPDLNHWNHLSRNKMMLHSSPCIKVCQLLLEDGQLA
jgi:hypothetical protein